MNFKNRAATIEIFYTNKESLVIKHVVDYEIRGDILVIRKEGSGFHYIKLDEVTRFAIYRPDPMRFGEYELDMHQVRD